MVFLCGHSVVSFLGIQVKSAQNIACSTIDIDMYRMLYPVYNIQIFVNTVHYCFLLPHLSKPTHSIIYHPVPPTGTHHVPKCHLSRKRRRQPRRLKSNEAPRINQKKNGKLGRWRIGLWGNLWTQVGCDFKGLKSWSLFLPLFFGRENGRKWQYWSMRTYFRHLDCRRFEFYLVVSGCGSTKLWKRRGTHMYIQKYTHSYIWLLKKRKNQLSNLGPSREEYPSAWVVNPEIPQIL